MSNWRGIMKVIEIKHLRDNQVLWHKKDIKNILHLDGEEFLLRAAFTGGQDSSVIPENYYLGLDNRVALDEEDTIDNLLGEPTGNGYERQEVSSSGDFTVADENGHFRATSKIVSFRAEGGSWGPVSNLFLTDSESDDGYLISSVALSDDPENPINIEVADGDTLTLRLALTLRDCPLE